MTSIDFLSLAASALAAAKSVLNSPAEAIPIAAVEIIVMASFFIMVIVVIRRFSEGFYSKLIENNFSAARNS